MGSPDNLPSLEQWTFLQPFADPLLQIFARDDCSAVTRALQMSFYPDESPTPDPPSPVLQTPTVSGSDPEAPAPPKRHPRIPINGKLSKRKSRASKRTNTTFITADPSNFRQMVQQVTGIGVGCGQQLTLPTVLKPEAQRAGGRGVRWPTLDTSEFLLDHQRQELASLSSYPSSLVADGGLIHFPSVGVDSTLPAFPTLESWKVM